MEHMLRVNTDNFDSFDDEEWWTPESTCWQFAIGDNSEGSRLVGDTIDQRVTASQIRRDGLWILKDCIERELYETYGYMVEETIDAYDLPEEALFKMAILVDETGKYHMMRMYRDGTWWRKWAGVQPTDIGPVTGGKIVNPLHECLKGHKIFFMDVYRDEW